MDSFKWILLPVLLLIAQSMPGGADSLSLQDFADDRSLDWLPNVGSDAALVRSLMLLNEMKRSASAAESTRQTGPRRTQQFRYHACYFNPISCFRKRDSEYPPL